MAKLPDLTHVAENSVDKETGTAKPPETIGNRAKATGTLAAYLKDKKATSNQVRKFLAAAAWLHDSEGKNSLTSADITAALNSHNQGKLTKPGQLLTRNAGKGHIVKDGTTFYVSDDGREELGK